MEVASREIPVQYDNSVMIEMKRPQHVDGLPADETSSTTTTNRNSPQLKHPRRIAVQHEGNAQHQPQYQMQHQPHHMPVPQPTGFYPHQTSVPIPVTVDPSYNQQQPAQPSQRVKNSIPIPVHHVPIVGTNIQIRPMNREAVRSVPVQIQHQVPAAAQVIQEIPINKNVPSEELKTPIPSSIKIETQKRPLAKKRTSLIVSDHTTPIPMPYEQLEDKEIIEEEVGDEDSQQEASSTGEVTKKPPILRKQTSLIVSDDHTTPIPMPYQQSGRVEEVLCEDPLEEDSMNEYEEKHAGGETHELEELESCDEVDSKLNSGATSDSADKHTSSPQLENIVQSSKIEPIMTGEDTPAAAAECSQEDMDEDEPVERRMNLDSPSVPFSSPPSSVPEEVPMKVFPVVDNSYNLSSVGAIPTQEKRIPIRVEYGDEPNRTQREMMPNHQTQHHVNQQNRTHPTNYPVSGPGMPQPQTGIYPEHTMSRPPMRSHDTQAQPATSSNGPVAQPAAETRDTYTQPKPPAPKPKQQWVDPRITSAIETIEKMSEEVEDLGHQVDVLQVETKDRTYLKIEEQLTKLLLKLDSIDSLGDDGVRTKRKACIKQVQQTLDALELKLLS